MFSKIPYDEKEIPLQKLWWSLLQKLYQPMPLLHYGILQAVKVCDTCAEILGFQSNGDRSSNNNFETSTVTTTTTNSDNIDDDDDYNDN